MATGKAREGWDLDLSYGKVREFAFANILFDATVEVKAQEKARLTGNVFIEFRQHGKPSGIATSTAQFWAIEYANDSWVVLPREKLAKIARAYYKKRGSVYGGDEDKFEGVLIPLAELVQYDRLQVQSNQFVR